MDNELKAEIAEIEEELKGYMTTIGGGSVTEMLRRRTVLLKRALAQLQGQWVSVEDELPEFNIPVLVYCKIYGRYITTYENHGEYSEFLDWEGKGGALPPTHWQALPSTEELGDE